MKKIENLSIIWISKICNEEDNKLKEHLELLSEYDVEKVIVGHTNLDPKKYKFNYIPFYDYGLDSLALISLKKNLGVLNSTKKYCLVLHADTRPDVCKETKQSKTLDCIDKKDYREKDIIAPIGFLILDNVRRGLTYADTSEEGTPNYQKYCESNLLFSKDVRHKLPDEPCTEHTYISGAALLGARETIIKTGWRNDLGWVQGEDVEYSNRLRETGHNIYCDKDIIVHMWNAT